MIVQEVKAAATEAVNDLAAHEKQRVGLEEQSKHAESKAKKLKKSVQDVSCRVYTWSSIFNMPKNWWLQDENAKAAAIRTIEDISDKMEKKKVKVEEYELYLDKEEKSLKAFVIAWRVRVIFVPSSQNHAAIDIYIHV
jgi:hypothetical protein